MKFFPWIKHIPGSFSDGKFPDEGIYELFSCLAPLLTTWRGWRKQNLAFSSLVQADEKGLRHVSLEKGVSGRPNSWLDAMFRQISASTTGQNPAK
jgi:hypothetical protein